MNSLNKLQWEKKKKKKSQGLYLIRHTRVTMATSMAQAKDAEIWIIVVIVIHRFPPPSPPPPTPRFKIRVSLYEDVHVFADLHWFPFRNHFNNDCAGICWAARNTKSLHLSLYVCTALLKCRHCTELKWLCSGSLCTRIWLFWKIVLLCRFFFSFFLTKHNRR